MDRGLFTAFTRAERPLSVYLEDVPGVRRLLADVESAQSLGDLDRFRGEELVSLINGVRLVPPKLGAAALGRIDESDRIPALSTSPRPDDIVYRVRYEVDGDVECLRHWPDRTGADLATVDQELMDRIGGYRNLGRASWAETDEYWRLDGTWRLQLVHEDGPLALYTYVGMTAGQERTHARHGTLGAVFAGRRAHVELVVEAIASQVDTFFDVDLPATVKRARADRRRVLRARAANIASLDLGDDWVRTPGPPAPALPSKPSEPLGPSATATATAPDTAAPQVDAAPVGESDQTTGEPVASAAPGRAEGTGDPSASGAARVTTPAAARSRVAARLRKGGGQPHWLIPTVVGSVLALVLAWFGVDDWRVPFVGSGGAARDSPNPSDTTQPGVPSGTPTETDVPTDGSGGSTAPVRVTKLPRGGVDLDWSIVDDPELRGYSIDVTAVRPIEYVYGVPRYPGDSGVTERIYPARYLNGLLDEAGDPRQVESGQLWHVCVQGMRDVPPGQPIDDYIIAGTRSCSDDFRLP